MLHDIFSMLLIVLVENMMAMVIWWIGGLKKHLLNLKKRPNALLISIPSLLSLVQIINLLM